MSLTAGKGLCACYKFWARVVHDAFLALFLQAFHSSAMGHFLKKFTPTLRIRTCANDGVAILTWLACSYVKLTVTLLY